MAMIDIGAFDVMLGISFGTASFIELSEDADISQEYITSQRAMPWDARKAFLLGTSQSFEGGLPKSAESTAQNRFCGCA